MRRLIVLLVAAVALLAACGGSADDPGPTAGPTRSATAGEVEVSATPMAVGDGAAVFRLAFDTHTVDLDFDPAAVARLDTPTGVVLAETWDGAEAGGHHREGELRFATDAALGDVRLTLALDEPVVLDWQEEE